MSETLDELLELGGAVDRWDYEAPMFVDFIVYNDDGIDDESYFNVDHEVERALSLGEIHEPSLSYEQYNTNHKSASLGAPQPSGSQCIDKNGVTSSGHQRQQCTSGPSAHCSHPQQPLDIIANLPAGKAKGRMACTVRVQSETEEDVDVESDDTDDVDEEAGSYIHGSRLIPVSQSTTVRDKGTGRDGDEERYVDIVTSAKKRLSMSVDRGCRKLNILRRSVFGHGATLVNRERSMDHLERIASPGHSSPAQDRHKVVDDSSRGCVRRRILGAVENLPSSSCFADHNYVVQVDGAWSNNPQHQKTTSLKNCSPVHQSRLTRHHATIAETSHGEESLSACRTDGGGEKDDSGARGIVRAVTSGNQSSLSSLSGAASVPHTGVPFFLPLASLKITTAQPFSFDQRNRRLAESKERKIQELIAEERKAHVFHAKPFPTIIYKHGNHQNTGFSLSGAASANTVSGASLGEKPASHSAMSPVGGKPGFKARPPTVLQKAPFVPARSNKPPTAILKSFEKRFKERAAHRADVEAARRERAAKEEEERMERLRLKEEQEQEEIKKERAKTIHRAKPIRYRTTTPCPAPLPALSVAHSTAPSVSQSAATSAATSAARDHPAASSAAAAAKAATDDASALIQG